MAVNIDNLTAKQRAIDATTAVDSNSGKTVSLVLNDVTTETTVGAAGGATALPATPNGYADVVIGGVRVKVPFYNP
jgi:hypothetical protein